MQKNAQSKELDPRDRKLRENKKNFNIAVSHLISNLIDAKRQFNGQPSSFTNKQPGRIHEPIKGDPGSVLAMLASDFQEISQKGNEIIQEQLEYSKTRRQKQVKQPQAPTALPSDLSSQLALFDDYNLIAEASNPISRTISRLKGPWFGNSPEARVRKYRLSMLRTAALLEEELKNFEVAVLGASSESIFKSSKLLQQAAQRLSYLFDTFSALGTVSPQQLSPVPAEEVVNNNIIEGPTTEENKNIKEPTTEEPIPQIIFEADRIINDFRKNKKNFNDLNRTLEKKLADAVKNYLFIHSNDIPNRVKMSEKILEFYAAILSDINIKRNTSANSLEGVLLSKLKEASAQIEITAQKILKKWLGKAHHKINPFNETSPMRLEVSKVSEETRKLTDQLMELLEEKDLNQDLVGSLLKKIIENFNVMKTLMRPLEGTIKNKMFGSTFVNMLGNNDLPYFSQNMDKKQKQQFEQSLLRRDLRDLTNTYNK